VFQEPLSHLGRPLPFVNGRIAKCLLYPESIMKIGVL